MISSGLRQIVVDAGPLIGLLHQRDSYHDDAMRGFHQLDQGRTMLIVPLPIVLEVYKWLLQRAGLRLARMGLSLLRERVEIVHLAQPDFEASLQLLFVHADWLGTIEDAVVAQTALRLDAPVWTYNYRDLNAFPNLHFWTPA